MNYHDAFEALNSGDFRTAASLLEHAARETDYTSDIINHAYTLALHHIGDKVRLADVSFRVGNQLLQTDPASAMDYFQRALVAGLDPKHIRRIGEVFEGWAASRPAAAPSLPINRVAHVVGCLLPGHAPAQYTKLLTTALQQRGIQSTVFTTEWAASWFVNPSGVPQSQPMEIAGTVEIASVEGDFMERAQRIADAIKSSGIQVAFFHTGVAEQISARVAAMKPVPVQVQVDRGGGMDWDLWNGSVHVLQNAAEPARTLSRTSEWIPLASDIETRLLTTVPVSRHSLGLDSAGSLSGTFGSLDKAAGSGFLNALAEILKRFPNHFHLFAGPGSVKTIRSFLHSEGVLTRVRFLGDINDFAPLLMAVDICLASFPNSDTSSVIEAMGVGKPVVVMKVPPSAQPNSGAAELVGLRELTAPGQADYVEIADQLLRHPAKRKKQGEAVVERFRSNFRPEQLGQRYVDFINRLAQPKKIEVDRAAE